MIDPDRHVLIPNIVNTFAALDALRPTERRHCSHCEAMRMAQSMSGEGRSAGADAKRPRGCRLRVATERETGGCHGMWQRQRERGWRHAGTGHVDDCADGAMVDERLEWSAWSVGRRRRALGSQPKRCRGPHTCVHVAECERKLERHRDQRAPRSCSYIRSEPTHVASTPCASAEAEADRHGHCDLAPCKDYRWRRKLCALRERKRLLVECR